LQCLRLDHFVKAAAIAALIASRTPKARSMPIG
jgi:hypothetical protein